MYASCLAFPYSKIMGKKRYYFQKKNRLQSTNGSFRWDMNFTQLNAGHIKEKVKNDTTLLWSAILQKANYRFLQESRNMVIYLILLRMEMVLVFLLKKRI